MTFPLPPGARLLMLLEREERCCLGPCSGLRPYLALSCSIAPKCALIPSPGLVAATNFQP